MSVQAQTSIYPSFNENKHLNIYTKHEASKHDVNQYEKQNMIIMSNAHALDS